MVEHLLGDLGFGADAQDGNAFYFFAELVFVQSAGIYLHLVAFGLEELQGLGVDVLEQEHADAALGVGDGHG